MSSTPAPTRLWRIAALSLLGMGVGVAVGRAIADASMVVAVGAVAAVSLVMMVLRVVVLRPDRALSASRTKEELVELVETSSADGRLQARSAEMLSRSTRFTDTTAAEVLTPRTSIVALSHDAEGADLQRLARETGYSRALLYDGDLDDVVGVVHVKALLDFEPEQRATVKLADLRHDVIMVPETRSLPDLLAEMRARQLWLAVVLDEYGGTAGIVTLEDVLETLVGEIDDEHDRTQPRRSVVRLAGTSVLPGDLNLAGVADEIGLRIPDGPYETLSGFVMEQLGHIPEVGESFEFDGHNVEVLEMGRHRVAAVRVREPLIETEVDR